MYMKHVHEACIYTANNVHEAVHEACICTANNVHEAVHEACICTANNVHEACFSSIMNSTYIASHKHLFRAI